MKLSPVHFGVKRSLVTKKPIKNTFIYYDKTFVRGKEVFKQVFHENEYIESVSEWRKLKKKYYKWDQLDSSKDSFLFSKRDIKVSIYEYGAVAIDIANIETGGTSCFFANGISTDLFDLIIGET